MAEIREKTWMEVHKDASPAESRSPGVTPRVSRMREAPEVYFLPRYSVGYTVAKYSCIVVAGLAVGMGIERWIRRKVQEDGGYIIGGRK